MLDSTFFRVRSADCNLRNPKTLAEALTLDLHIGEKRYQRMGAHRDCAGVSVPTRRAGPRSSGSGRRIRRDRQEGRRGLPRDGRGRAGRRSIRRVRA